MMRIKANKIYSLLFCIFILTITVITLLAYSQSSAQTANTNCSGATISVNDSQGQPTTLLRGLVNVNVTIPTNSAQIDNIIIGKQDSSGTKKVLGRARYSNNQVWSMPWLTSLLNMSTMDRYQNYLYAQITYSYSGATNVMCSVVSTNQYNVEYQNQSTLTITASPREWSGITSSTQLFSASLSVLPNDTITSFNPLQYAIISWVNSGSIGSLNKPVATMSNNELVNFVSGTTAGTTTLLAKAVYGGSEALIEIPISVRLPESTTVTSENTTTTNNNNQETNTNTEPDTTTSPDTATNNTTDNQATTTDTTTTATTVTDTQIASSKIQIDESTETCVETIIGAERYDAIDSGTTKPTASELSQTSSCFASTNYILPTKFLPIDPVKIDEVAVTARATIENVENPTTTSTDEPAKLKFSGKAEPNSIVLVYIFSDPIIVTVSTDSDGNWEYTLEDPMQPGRHEVYAVVNKGDGTFERTNPMAFFISTASASEVNPDGLSLTLSDIPTRTASSISSNLVIYIAGSILAILVALTIFFLTLRSHNFHRLALINRANEIRLETKTYDYPKTYQPESITSQATTSPEPLNDTTITPEPTQTEETLVTPSAPRQITVTSDDSTDIIQPTYQENDNWTEPAQPTIETSVSENTNNDSYESQ